MDDSGLHVSFNFRTTYLGISNNFWCGFWVNGQLLHCFYWHIIKLSVGSSAFFASCTCLSTGRLSGGHKQTWCICDYIGLENSILGARKLRFFCERNLAHTNTNNMCRNSWLSLNLPSNYGVNETISTNFAFFFLFVLNVGTLNIAWAWNKLYNKHCGLFAIGLGSTLYWNVGELERHVLVSHRLNQQWHLDVDWYDDTRNAHEPNIVFVFEQQSWQSFVYFSTSLHVGIWYTDEIWMFEIIEIISSWTWLHIFTMQIESKFDGTFSVKSSAATQAHFAVSELRISTC